jgi:hypothetical protein
MIEITINDKAGYVGITGHAGYAEPGRDIICAGVSALFFALAEATNRAEGILRLVTEKGKSALSYRPSRAAARRLSVFRAGVEMLEESYPDFVRVIEQGRKNPAADDTMSESEVM